MGSTMNVRGRACCAPRMVFLFSQVGMRSATIHIKAGRNDREDDKERSREEGWGGTGGANGWEEGGYGWKDTAIDEASVHRGRWKIMDRSEGRYFGQDVGGH